MRRRVHAERLQRLVPHGTEPMAHVGRKHERHAGLQRENHVIAFDPALAATLQHGNDLHVGMGMGPRPVTGRRRLDPDAHRSGTLRITDQRLVSSAAGERLVRHALVLNDRHGVSPRELKEKSYAAWEALGYRRYLSGVYPPTPCLTPAQHVKNDGNLSSTPRAACSHHARPRPTPFRAPRASVLPARKPAADSPGSAPQTFPTRASPRPDDWAWPAPSPARRNRR